MFFFGLNLLAVERNGRRDMPSQNVRDVGQVDHPQMHLGVGAARCWIPNAACLWKRAGTLTAGCHHRSGGKPRIGHHADIGVVERSVDQAKAVFWRPNGFGKLKYFLCEVLKKKNLITIVYLYFCVLKMYIYVYSACVLHGGLEWSKFSNLSSTKIVFWLQIEDRKRLTL